MRFLLAIPWGSFLCRSPTWAYNRTGERRDSGTQFPPNQCRDRRSAVSCYPCETRQPRSRTWADISTRSSHASCGRRRAGRRRRWRALLERGSDGRTGPSNTLCLAVRQIRSLVNMRKFTYLKTLSRECGFNFSSRCDVRLIPNSPPIDSSLPAKGSTGKGETQ